EVLHRELYFSEEELRTEIEQYPERFSPNVVMRPLYQELILPNLAYIGGGAEIVYWLQLKANFDYYQMPFPILVPRNSAMITDDNIAGKDRKSTRLNSSHVKISYAVFCLKKKNKPQLRK